MNPPRYRNRLLILSVACAASALLSTALPLRADPVSPGAAYLDKTKPIPERIADAKALIADSSTDAPTLENATYTLDLLVLTIADPNAYATGGVRELCESLITNKGKALETTTANHALSLFAYGLVTKARLGIGTAQQRVDFLKPYVTSLPSDPGQGDPSYMLRRQYAYYLDALATEKIRARKYDEALAIANSPEVLNVNPEYIRALTLIVQAKTKSNAADVIQWAKALYLVAPYENSQDVIFAVMGAIRGPNMNLAAADAFFASQNQPGGTPNALTGVPIPTALANWKVPNGSDALNALVHGDVKSALDIATADVRDADPGPDLKAAMQKLAIVARGADLTMVQANAIIQAANAGTPYTVKYPPTATPAPGH